MAKKRTVFVCQECGYRTPKWAGRCPECGSWGSFVEEVESPKPKRQRRWVESEISEPVPIGEVTGKPQERLRTGIEELDRVLGGGIVKGSVSLFSGEPGVGKSTLLLQVAGLLAEKGRVLYVTAEESPEQVALRARRLGVESKNLYLLAENNLEAIAQAVEKLNPLFAVFDSIQTLYLPEIESAAGSVSQVRESAAFITNLSKRRRLTSFIVGHVTKEGSIAGPKVLEHIVDAVFQFEGDRGYNFRILKSLKNRFGSSGELAVFEMTESGLKEVPNPSQFFLAERPKGKAGSVIFAGIEGSRPILLEVQALVTRAIFTTPQRKAKGISPNRLSIIVAVLEKELGIPLRNFDVFVNVVGGVKVDEPAVDLPVAAAIVSSYFERPVREDVALFGEIGLTGEVRRVKLEEVREKEAKKNNLKTFKSIKTLKDLTKLI
ncbi:DNA repair protein RadA [Thermovibrio ammonificans HB-1]|uniref:DNA repair protein RadA n=1 Tax=Thermovibrio ammonificans (strain DSM 15698 / JCM 12110 / HB-1) TaxID=648996 RepID=E8T466_THEA1|nr:DNA repair protein RadA [Thermovibrio ammonificans]ADU97395.1 DNA repair protein RadA [Thermovibrio ammonificans HB-1]